MLFGLDTVPWGTLSGPRPGQQSGPRWTVLPGRGAPGPGAEPDGRAGDEGLNDHA